MTPDKKEPEIIPIVSTYKVSESNLNEKSCREPTISVALTDQKI
jgi:hypothetical protein